MVNYPNGKLDPEKIAAEHKRLVAVEQASVGEAVSAITVTLTVEHRSLLTFIEQYWYQNQAYPSAAAFNRWAEESSLTFPKVRSLELDLIDYLAKRGITPSKADTKLTQEQLAAANLILNYTDRRSKANKLKALGITPTQWDGWLRQKIFKEYLANRTGEMLDLNTDVAHTGLLGAVERGEAAALKLYYEMTGHYRQDSPQANINVIMTLLIEVIQKEITDPDLLRRIAAGFELVMLRQATGLATGTTGAIAGVSAGQQEVIEYRDSALDAHNVRNRSLPREAQKAPSALEL